MTLFKIAFNVLLVVMNVCTLIYLFPLIRVDGVSMLPTYKHNTLLLAIRFSNPKRLKVGQVYVFTRVDDEGELHVVIKRLTQIHKVGKDILCHFEGDNEAESYDSRYYGFIKAEQIIAKVLWQVKK